MKKIIIVGATSGIGKEVAEGYLRQGWQVGVAGRRVQELEAFKALAPEQIEIQPLDVTETDAPEKLQILIDKLGGMDLFLHSSGIGSQNRQLDAQIELNTAKTNVEGFIRMVTKAFDYFRKQGGGHLAIISSIAGTRGLGVAPAYSATKRFQNTYIEALEQLSCMEKLNISFTDIRPGFVATAFLKNDKYPMLMQADEVAERIIYALNSKKHVVTIDCCYAVLVFFWRMIPRWLWRKLPISNRA